MKTNPIVIIKVILIMSLVGSTLGSTSSVGADLFSEKILMDTNNRISEDFSIPPGIMKRTRFWFDVYTKYSVDQNVLHHKDYPWIVFQVVDVKPIMDQYKNSKNKWTKYHKSAHLIKSERLKIKNALLGLAKRRPYDVLDLEEKKLADLLSDIPGKNRKKVFLVAAQSIRTQLGQKEFIEKGISNSSSYLPYMEYVFTDKNLPAELTRIPFVESSFNIDAESKVGASGIWQFMPQTGKQFMKVGEHIDERNSPLKSTVAAAKLLKQYKRILGKWPLAITAYNHGVGGLREAIRKTKTSDLGYLINNYKAPSFGFASANFYASFLAILHAEKYKNEIFIQAANQESLAFKELKLKRSIRIAKLIKVLEIDPAQFKKFNKDLSEKSFKANIILPKGYRIHLPESYIDKLKDHFALLKPMSRNL